MRVTKESTGLGIMDDGTMRWDGSCESMEVKNGEVFPEVMEAYRGRASRVDCCKAMFSYEWKVILDSFVYKWWGWIVGVLVGEGGVSVRLWK